MKRLAVLAVLAVVAGCDNSSPAGGQGYFDPPQPERFTPPPPIIVEPQAGAVPSQTQVPQSRGVAGDPRSAVGTPETPNSQLAADVTAALERTAPVPSAAAPATPPNAAAPATTPSTAALPPVTTLPAPGATGTQVAGVPAGSAMPGSEDIGIDPNAQSIDLNASSQAVQKQQREAAQRRREAAQDQLVVVAPEPVPQQDISANVVEFAKSTTHPRGTKVYNRPMFRDRRQASANCRGFSSDTEAQRQFLANGGPQTDRFNLDPDGDGFACGFDPERYRRLQF